MFERLNSRPIIFVIILLVIIGASFFAGLKTGEKYYEELTRVEGIYNKEHGKPGEVDFYPFWKTWNLINDKHASVATSTEKEVSTQEKIWGAIQGLTYSLNDPYTVFLPPSENELFEADIQGEFSGVGMEIGIRDGILTVVSPLKGTPAERAGLESGDKILEVDGESTARFSVDEAVLKIRGKKGTNVVLTILREDEEEPREIIITRDTIDIPTLETTIRGDVFIISLYNFSANSPDLFRNALQDFLKSKADKLIIDLRGNPGGYLEASIDMASWFLESGKIIVTEDYNGSREPVEHRSRGYDIFSDDLPLVVLIDGGSASASEILAGALEQHGKAKLIGEQTFGKGSIQELISITPETSLKITIAHWLTPDGSVLSDIGLAPNIEISDNPDTFEDEQLEKAIEVLREI